MCCWRSSVTEWARRAAWPLGAAALLVVAGQARAGDPVATSPATSASGQVQAAPQQPAIQLDELLAQLASMEGLSAKFREEKFMALLAVPLVNEGELHFAPPGRLVRHVHTPSASTVLIDGGQLSVADGAGHERIDLAGNPAVRLFVDSFLKIYAGDQDALQRMYAMQFSASGQAWTLTLRPTVAPLDKVIARVELQGEGVVLKTMKVVELGGDETITTFFETRRRSFTPAELTELFRLPAAGG